MGDTPDHLDIGRDGQELEMYENAGYGTFHFALGLLYVTSSTRKGRQDKESRLPTLLNSLGQQCLPSANLGPFSDTSPL